MNAPKAPNMIKRRKGGGDGPDKPGYYKASAYGKSWVAGPNGSPVSINESLAKKSKTGATKGMPSPTKDGEGPDKPGYYKQSGYGKSWKEGPNGKPMPINERLSRQRPTVTSVVYSPAKTGPDEKYFNSQYKEFRTDKAMVPNGGGDKASLSKKKSSTVRTKDKE